jgi:putative ABC transport system ATP-binding protein
LLRTLNREQHKTVIVVTHDQKAADFATRQLQVDKGSLTDVAAASRP